jgi:hypothetical protein
LGRQATDRIFCSGQSKPACLKAALAKIESALTKKTKLDP